MGEIKINQIIIVTDGRSNVGGDPIIAAGEAAKKNIFVSAIGIIDNTDDSESPIEEVQNIANKGGGEWELTYIENLSTTLHMLTQRTVNKTINTVVNKQLKEIIGAELDEIKPESRNKFIKYIENLSDEIHLKCCVLMDCSGSMKIKINKARESIIDLMNSLKARKGKSEVAVIAFPGLNREMIHVVNDFSNDIELIKNKINNMGVGGTTPTAPAIYKAIELFTNKPHESEKIIEEEPLFNESII
ncbi:VWA domain-containing protein [Paramaledivibacter caminithermalis]|uniref:Ca-activated chloride channel family protein n=1 Tax=Paramaledivibacter caminithermalis (strain DSM 15212 / CIP 107654 / DViRD3) TaxID=1121301 RepID=A0A1M6N0H8_PARC5|nr:VWA domain-containing protein [Paramaledivibacter caminithermalis]SHJ89102.1 Ca-activated chloride channel family protein [Paramaledivibacter caminithermalis DSM 15212]